jgi:transcriptional regulator with XRE-family HTH domain
MAKDTNSDEARRIIGDNIRRLREETGLSRQELADEVETTRGVVHELENRLKSPSVEMLGRFARTFTRLLQREITSADLLTAPRAGRKEPAGVKR